MAPPSPPLLPIPLPTLPLPDAACFASTSTSPATPPTPTLLDFATLLPADEAFWRAHDEIERLGRGCFGSVLLVRQRSTRRVVAVKVTASTKRDCDDQCPLREAELLRAVGRHPHVCRLLDVFQTATTLFILQEAERTDLMAHTLAQPAGVLTEDEARRHLQGLLCAVQHIHALGIVHRDIKATNVLLSSEGSVRLADFGLAARLPDDGLLTAVCGTHDYLAPEMVRCGHGETEGYSTPVDLWGVGLLLYALLFGSNPFERSTDIETLQAILAGDFALPPRAARAAPAAPPSTTREAQELIAQLLVTDPHARLSAQQALDHGWLRPVAAAS